MKQQQRKTWENSARIGFTTLIGAGCAMAQDDLLTVEEVARQLRVDVTTVRRWIGNGSLHAIRLPGASRDTPSTNVLKTF